MPEGPEIRLAADDIENALVDRSLERVVFKIPALKKYEKELTGQTVLKVETRGKAMLTHFSGGLSLYSHNQLYGRWYITDGQLPNTKRNLRVGLFNRSQAALLYSASDIELLTPTGISQHRFLNRLGPDVLGDDTDPEVVLRQLSGDKFKRRSLGSLYLDQGFVAGIGNYLRSEILFFAGLHHELKPMNLSNAQLKKLARQTCVVSQRSYRTRGVTNPTTVLRTIKKTQKGYEGYRFAVFARANRPCYHCGTKIQKTDVQSRRLYFCPKCQPV